MANGAKAMLAALDAVTPNASAGAPVGKPAGKAQARPAGGTRDGLKHIGGYLDDETSEKVARLKVWLKADNSRVLAQAIDLLWAQENARRRFGAS